AREVAEVVTRFTPLALTSVGLILATGTWASVRHIPRVSDLWETTYGLLVLAKIALLLVLLFIGYVNKEIIGPRLRSGRATPRTPRDVTETPSSSGPNEWTLNGFSWSSPGTWKVYVLVQTKTFTKFSFDLDVQPASS